MKRVFISGTAGFIGYHLAHLLLQNGFRVHGYDGLTDYYDVGLKQRRHAMLNQHQSFSTTEAMLEDEASLSKSLKDFSPDVIVHLAAQAGVRFSTESPRSYLQSNIVGTFNIMDIARELDVEHLLIASSSSVYGANQQMPYREVDKADTQMSFYAASKKASEAMAHSYAHINNLPITMFRFFTVYGPWGRPDMALFKFTDAILDGKPIDIYNHGDMWRDFTYVTDLVRGIRLLIDAVPEKPNDANEVTIGDSLSPVAPFRIVNIGNSDRVRLLDFIEAIEDVLGRKATRNFMDMQPGDVPATWADASLLQSLTGYRPETPLKEGIAQFVSWFRDYYQK